MAGLRFVSLTSEACGEAALSLLPIRGEAPAEVCVNAAGLQRIDAWGAVALRVYAELHARIQQRQVTLTQPKDAGAWRMLFHLLCSDPPKHLVPSNDSSLPAGAAPSAIHLPAVRIPSADIADQLAEALLSRPAGRLTRALRFAAGQLPLLVENALIHGSTSPIKPVACCFYDAEEDELQLVVADLGTRYDRETDPAKLLAAVEAQPDGSLVTMVEVAEARGIDVTLTLAAGAGRVYWRAGAWSTAVAQAVPGFTAALSIQLED